MEVQEHYQKENVFSILLKKNKTRIFLIFILLFSLPQISISQEYIRGVVVNNVGKPISSAIVKHLGNSQEKTAYCLTDKRGKFYLPVTSGLSSSSVIYISHIGFQNVKYHITDYSVVHTIVLKDEDVVLPELIVKNVPIKNVGDTLHYQVASFKKASDKSLEDVLKRLPGISIESSGRISYKGESINKFYIEGLDLLSGQYAIATKNINADDIATVSVYENHQPQRILKGIEFSNKAALNIKIKDQRKLKPFGTIKVGIGYGDAPLWIGESVLMSAGRNRQSLSFLKSNVTGVLYENEFQTLTETDFIISHTGNDFSRHPFATNKIPEEKYKSNHSIASSNNIIFKINETTNFVINANYSSDASNYNGNNVMALFCGSSSPIQIFNQHESEIHSKQVNVKFNIENNAERLFLSEKLNLSGHFSSNNYRINEQNSMLEEALSINTYNVINNFIINKRCGSQIISFTSDIALLKTPVNFIDILNRDNDDIKHQSIKSMSLQSRETVSHSWLIGNYSTLGAKLLFDFYHLHVNNNLLTREQMIENVGNGYNYSIAIAPTYQFHKNSIKWKFEFPIGFHSLWFKQAEENIRVKYHKPHLDISTSLYYAITNHSNISLSYRKSHMIGDLVSLFKIPLYQTYRDLSYIGSDDIAENCSQSVIPLFDYRNTLSGVFFSIRGIWQVVDRNFVKNSQIKLNETTYEIINIKNRINTYNCQLNISKHFYSQDLSISAIGNYLSAKRKVMRQDKDYLLKTNSYNINLCIKKSWFSESIITDFEYDILHANRHMGQNTNQETLENKFISNITIIPFSSIEMFASAKTCYGKLSSSHYKYAFLDCGVRLKTKHIESELLFRNISNQRSFEYYNIQGVDEYTSYYQLRPFEVIASMKYSF